ncbi:serine/threonine protein kinase [Flavobacteriaceae bacterium]|nr:serine/threonine protein kinase [Flavobacteriaceae bacterium]|tara:strand:+ start:252 stop:1091 length:840 start_codon:yes stop_codon:yes gene_type:complete
MFPDLGSQYEFIKELGSGGTGVVNLAVDRDSGFLVAIKTLFDFHINDEEILEKFKVEANIYLMLKHPNIVSLKNFILKKGKPHLVQEYVEGQTLDEYINNVTGPIPTKRAIEIIKKVLSAIGYAHNKNIPISGYNGILHLDIKPGNIIITKNGNVKIIDYGISQGNSEKRGDKVMGSPLYMAPEQIDISQELDKRTDIYSLGVLLFQMITGSRPFSYCKSMEELFRSIYYSSLTKTSEIYPGVDIRFQSIIDKATEKHPDDRFQSCDDFLFNIEQLEKI